MLLNIDKVELSKTGKSYRVTTVGGVIYTCKAKGIEQCSGKTIEAIVGSFDYQGHTNLTIESFVLTATQPSLQVHVPSAARASNGDRWWLPFVSNQTAHLIEAKLITDKASLNQWMQDIKQAVLALDESDQGPDVPF